MIDDRAVSVTVNYALNLALATILIAGLLTVTGDVVDDRRQEATRNELSVVGNRIAADLMTADRLTRVGSDPEVRIETTLPERVAGTSYTVTIEATPTDSHLVLQTNDPKVRVNIPFRNSTAVKNETLSGGDLSIVLATDGRLEVRT